MLNGLHSGRIASFHTVSLAITQLVSLSVLCFVLDRYASARLAFDVRSELSTAYLLIDVFAEHLV
jgi:ABC-type maltose transport system permease subunit